MKFFFKSTDWFANLIGFALLLLLAGCEPTAPRAHEITGATMGTTYSIKVIGDDFDTERAAPVIEDRLREINQVFSTYIPDAEISRLNRAVGEAELPVSDSFMSLLRLAEKVHTLTEGAFDVTVGPLVNLWGFGPDGRPRGGIPAQAEIDAALARTGFDEVILLEEGIRRPPGLYIDFSAIAKGYAVDEIAALLDARGATRYLVEIGGEVRARGRNAADMPWQIGLEAPDRASRKLQRVMPLMDLGLATSGDYRNFFMHEGAIYSHTIDPVTGWPVKHNMASVTVLHESTAYADALATGFSVLGLEQTMGIAGQQDLAVLAIIREEDGYREVLSESMKRYLENYD